ncbi:dynamin family protein [Pseudonocardia acidicola]|uniref:GTP-binding protein n=1 Tax=Pseudonocardia acidicola TaxID=2724939 RepID=A0ABX1SDL0_9PSEU|nr:dynamin family protein [Pseudonocardia acidicola]NMH98942.1 GTP-binding protein [Pseudonocardia acidicola]
MTAPTVPSLGSVVRVLLRRTIDTYRDSPQAVGWLQHHLGRFDEPLRVAIAGKVKAGKSTLLNALVGEEIAPTDAGECTRVVTWYQDAPAPRVLMYPRSAPPRPLTISRSRGALTFDLQGTPTEDVDRLVVDWPSQNLRSTTLIDTPGIASLSADTSARAGAFLAPEDSPSQADAVIYLMRHLHASDVRFLESFFDQGVARATPVNTIAVLSRADEIGVGRLDALSSARRIARRYRSDDKLRGLCQTVVAVAGLLAQTGRTMRQDEFAALVELAALPRADLDSMLLSADRFVRNDPADRAVPSSDTRARLIERFGLFGVRLGTTLVRQGINDPTRIAEELVKRSGLDELRMVLNNQFSERRDLLKARSALLAVELVLQREPRPAAAPLAAEVERILAGAHEFAELRMLSTLRAGGVRLPVEAMEDAERLLGGDGGSAAARLGLPPGAGAADLRAAALDAVARWQRKAESPMSSRSTADAARVVVRSCEGILMGLGAVQR